MAWTDKSLQKFCRGAGTKPARDFDNFAPSSKGLFVERGAAPQSGKPASMSLMMAYTGPTKKRRTIGLGAWPSVSIAQAREKARQARQLLAEGIDPRDARDAERAAVAAERASEPTVADLLNRYCDRLDKRGARSAREVRRMFRTNVAGDLGDIPLDQVGRDDINRVLDRIYDRGAETMSNRARSYLRAAWEFGIMDTDLGIEINPVLHTRRRLKNEPVGERNLSWAEIRRIWEWTHAATHVSAYARSAIRLLLTTGVRVEEALGAMAEEFDDDPDGGLTWLIPGARRGKTGVPLAVALDPFHMKQFHLPERGPVFLNRFGKPMPSVSLNQVVKSACRETGVAIFSPRDIRRTYKTRISALGVPPHVSDRMQGHSIPGVSARNYNKYDYLSERREAMQTYLTRLRAVLDPAGNVVELSA